MCSTDFGMLDLLFDRDDPACKSLDGFKNTMFSSTERLPDLGIKEEVLESGTIDWKMSSSEWDADELLRSVLDGGDVSTESLGTPTLGTLNSLGSLGSLGTLGTLSNTPSTLHTPTLEAPDDMDDLDDLVGLPFHAVMDSGASDSGMSSDSSLDQQVLSPLSGYSMASPSSLGEVGLGLGLNSPDHLDARSEVSSTSDLGSLGSTSPHSSASLAPPCTPEYMLGIDDLISDSGFSSPISEVKSGKEVNSEPVVTGVSASPVVVPVSSVPAVTRVLTTSRVAVTNASGNNGVSTVTTAPVLKTVSVPASSGVSSLGGQTIVVTQAGKGGPTAHVVRGGTLLKSAGQTSRSILLPVSVKDLNQVRTIKIISTGGNGGVAGRGVRTVVSTVRPPTTTLSTPAIRTAVLTSVKGQESKSILKGGATTVLTTSGRPATTAATLSTHTSPTRVKLEPDDDDDDDDDDDGPINSFQQLQLSDEEKRLLKKEGIQLPTHYPLTKQEERELKRIRRKIRNKISAQDSRKRKKEYIDGLEDRVKACTEENQQLQKRIKTLEAQNESLLVQMRRFQSVLNGGSSRSQVNASTALMMLILSAALFIVPSVRQDSGPGDSDLSLPASKMPSAGHSRSLLEAGNSGLVPNALELLEGVEDELPSELDPPQVLALTDHDYVPAAKRPRVAAKDHGYYFPPLDDIGPQNGKVDSGGGFPPDDSSGTKLATRLLDAMVNHVTNNYSDPGGQPGPAQAVVVNLGQGRKRLRDDIELE